MGKLIALCGKSGSGKDTMAESLIKRGFVPIAFGDELREAAHYMFPWLPKEWPNYKLKDEPFKHEQNKHNLTPRQIWQKLDSLKYIDTEWLANKTRNRIERILGSGKDVVVSDLRYLREIDSIRSNGGKIIRIRSSMEKPNDIGDSEVDKINFDDSFFNLDWVVNSKEENEIEFLNICGVI